MRCLLYRPSWQALRVSFLNENRSDGGWTTLTGTEANLRSIESYVKGVGPFFEGSLAEPKAMGYEPVHEFSVRLYRTINCLNAVRMGNSGQGLKGSPQDLAVLAARNDLQQEQTVNYHRYLTYASGRWDWRVVKRELQVEYDKANMHGMLDEIQRNLSERMRKAPSMRNRPELLTFMEILEEVKLGG
jgi:hypothetical protein